MQVFPIEQCERAHVLDGRKDFRSACHKAREILVADDDYVTIAIKRNKEHLQESRERVRRTLTSTVNSTVHYLHKNEKDMEARDGEKQWLGCLEEDKFIHYYGRDFFEIFNGFSEGLPELIDLEIRNYPGMFYIHVDKNFLPKNPAPQKKPLPGGIYGTTSIDGNSTIIMETLDGDIIQSSSPEIRELNRSNTANRQLYQGDPGDVFIIKGQHYKIPTPHSADDSKRIVGIFSHG